MNKFEIIDIEKNIENIERKIGINLSKNQNVIEFSPLMFKILHSIVKKFNLKVECLTTQRNFLTKLGVINRAEILAKNLKFLKKINIYHRLKRLIDKNSMGEIFKVMFVTKKNINFKIGF